MLLDLCRKNEGNLFSTKIWVVGSYTDTLLIALHVKEHRCRKFLAFSFHYTRQHNTAFAGRQISMWKPHFHQRMFQYALKEFTKNKTPGTDSFTSEFYKFFWPERCTEIIASFTRGGKGVGGGGRIPRKIGWGVLPSSQNPYPIYDQNLRYSLPYLWPDHCIKIRSQTCWYNLFPSSEQC